MLEPWIEEMIDCKDDHHIHCWRYHLTAMIFFTFIIITIFFIFIIWCLIYISTYNIRVNRCYMLGDKTSFSLRSVG